MKKQQTIFWGIGSAIVVISIAGIGIWHNYDNVLLSIERSKLPSPIAYVSPQPTKAAASPRVPTQQIPTPQSSKAAAQTGVASEINLKVPFTAQAPHAIWGAPYGELCEEASVLMAASYIKHETIASPAIADQKLLAIKAFEEKRFGYYEDTNAAETAIILREHYHLPKVELIENPTVADIQRALTNGKVVLAPVAGRQLHNPYFQQPGPLYHMIVIKGYTANGKFITHDPGTRRGADFLYSQDVIMGAIHDWRTDNKIELGRKVIIVVG